METHACPWSEERTFRVPSSGEEAVERWGVDYFEAEQAARTRGRTLERELEKQISVWYASIECEGDCKTKGHECQKGHLWVGPPDVVMKYAGAVKVERWHAKYRIELYATAKLKITCECGKPRYHGGKIKVD